MKDLEKTIRKYGEDAVSPVVGVMLMLVVVIIIAAVVSGYAGGLIGSNNQKSPSITMDVKVSNTGTWIGSGFSALVTSVSAPVQTKDIKLITSWKTTSRTDGSSIIGGNTSTPGVNNFHCYVGMKTSAIVDVPVPFGQGPGVGSDQDATNMAAKPAQHFGNFSLIQGTGLQAFPYGTTSGAAIGPSVDSSDDSGYGVDEKFTYTLGGNYDTGQVDATQAVLGGGWENLKAGDIVNVKIVYTPTGTTIFSKDVAVTEG